MGSEYTVFVVDDATVNRRILESALEKTYTVESFASGAACLERLKAKTPDLFLLDVDMPEMDGFTLCRRVKSSIADRDVPVIFVSALDDLDSRLAGYDAGGDDFIAKPFSFPEVKKKIDILRRAGEEKSSLRGQLDASAMLTSRVMSELEEYAALIKFLGALHTAGDLPALAGHFLEMLRCFRLKGALQLRLGAEELTVNHLGEMTPLEASIISHVRTLGTVETFKTRASFNFDHVTVLINNMPTDDAALCARCQSHLLVAVEAAEARLLAMQKRQEESVVRSEITEIVQSLGVAARDFGTRYKDARFHGTETIHLMQNELRGEFVSLGMSEVQEDAIQAIIEARTDRLVTILDFSAETEKTLAELSARLNRLLVSEVS